MWQATVSISWVQTVLGAAQLQGVNQAALLARAGISPQEMMRDRWPIDYITQLWRAAAQLTQDPSFGLRAGALVGPASFNAVTFILQSSATLREAIGMVQKYQRLISDGGRFQLLAGERASWLIYHPCQGDLAFSPHQIEAVLAAVISFARLMSASPMRPQLVQLSQSRLGPLAKYREVFDCPVEFDQAYSGLLLDNAILDQPLPQADSQLARIHEQYAAARLSALSQSSDLHHALRTWITNHIGPPLPTRAQAASAFGVTERTLARRLHARGGSFTDLLDEVRRSLALQQVSQTMHPFTDIAQNLGFAEISPFYRAFQRWTGTTPAQWRARHGSSSAN